MSVRRLLQAGPALMLAMAAAGAHPARANNACFAESDLKFSAAEKTIQRSNRKFDAAPDANPSEPLPPVAAALRGSIRSVKLRDNEKIVALTFDLCEQLGEVAGYDGAIFDYLRREGVKTTIFAGGKWLRSHERRAEQLMLNPLFEIASHGDLHRNLRALDAAAMKAEIAGPGRSYAVLRTKADQRQCAAATAAPLSLRLFRFPFGACNTAALDAVNDAGLLAIQWNVSTGDPDPLRSAQQIARTMVAGARPGAIIIAHANGRGWNTAAALPIAIPKLKAMGYRFVTVSELIALGEPVISKTCYNARPGDTDRYDFLLARRSSGSKPKARAVRAPASPRKSTPKKL
jgi:peptidoglycan/xylan/chitin deacetylase (PgdA/CDA1 family)